MNAVRLIMVGGFLGAGKTTLLWEAAARLMARGKRVGLITNDQAPDLVDTGLLAGRGLIVREVCGSCFCCNFDGLISAAEELGGDVGADVLIAEPVGSCTDLSATILQPLKERFAGRFVMSPLSVLADPVRLGGVLAGRTDGLHPSAAYILRKQLEEADMIVLNKCDPLTPRALAELVGQVRERFGPAEVRCISALKGDGVEDWLDAVLADRAAGERIAQVDYDTYAEGEAVLGWLNALIRLSAGADGVDWSGLCRGLLESLKQTFGQRGAAVGHVKLLLSAPGGQCVGNLASSGGEVSLRGAIPGRPEETHLVLNARVQMPPEELEAIIRRTLADVAGERVAVDVRHLQSLSPGRPKPTFRYRNVVS